MIIGDSLSITGGVPNYTRPLFHELLKTPNNVSYLYTSSYLKNYSFFKRKGIKKVGDSLYEYINCPNLASNFNALDNDVENREIENELTEFVQREKFEVIHIHSMLGLTSNLYFKLKQLNIKLFVTVHEYWWLCPHKVMVDFNKRICDGPTDFKKCAFCVQNCQSTKSSQQIKLVAKTKNDFPKIFDIGFKFKNFILGSNKENTQNTTENIAFLNIEWENSIDINLEKKLIKRFKANIDALNVCDKVIGVSNDVKNILTKFGVNEEIILVQHIGSTIAEKTIAHTKKVNSKKITFGFIGGVGYYKGVHQLVDAYGRLPKELKNKAELKIFGKYGEGYYQAIKERFISTPDDEKQIKFFGKFSPDEIPEISNQIDICVLPSLCADTAPQTIFESFSSGLPVIGPNVGGYPDFVRHEENGLIYEAANVDSLKETLIRIIENPELIVKFQHNITPSKTMKENVGELINLYHN